MIKINLKFVATSFLGNVTLQEFTTDSGCVLI